MVSADMRRLRADALRSGGIFPDFAGELLYGGGKERLILRYQSAELQSERLSRFKFGLHRADALTDIASDQPHAHFFAKRLRRNDALHHKIADTALRAAQAARINRPRRAGFGASSAVQTAAVLAAIGRGVHNIRRHQNDDKSGTIFRRNQHAILPDYAHSGAQSGFSCRIGYVRLGKMPGLGQLRLQRPCRMIRGVGREIIAVHKNAAIFFLCGRNIWPEHDGNALRPRIVRCGIKP